MVTAHRAVCFPQCSALRIGLVRWDLTPSPGSQHRFQTPRFPLLESGVLLTELAGVPPRYLCVKYAFSTFIDCKRGWKSRWIFCVHRIPNVAIRLMVVTSINVTIKL